MLKCAARFMAEAKGVAWVDKANLWPVTQHLDPTFDTKDHARQRDPPSCSAMAR